LLEEAYLRDDLVLNLEAEASPMEEETTIPGVRDCLAALRQGWAELYKMPGQALTAMLQNYQKISLPSTFSSSHLVLRRSPITGNHLFLTDGASFQLFDLADNSARDIKLGLQVVDFGIGKDGGLFCLCRENETSSASELLELELAEDDRPTIKRRQAVKQGLRVACSVRGLNSLSQVPNRLIIF
jgi:hypothetical protein